MLKVYSDMGTTYALTPEKWDRIVYTYGNRSVPFYGPEDNCTAQHVRAVEFEGHFFCAYCCLELSPDLFKQ